MLGRVKREHEMKSPSRPHPAERRRVSKRGALGLLDDLESQDRHAAIFISADALAAGDWLHLLPDSEPERSLAHAAASSAQDGDTGLALYVASDGAVAIRPPLPLAVDGAAARADAAPLRAMLASQPTIGVIMLRLGRFAVCVLRGERVLASKTDSRYMKNRHRAGGQSQRRFERSRERLIRELYDKTCETARTVFAPYAEDMDYIALGGERGVLDGFIKRCRLTREMKAKTLSRRLDVREPNQRAIEGAAREVWKSDVTFWELR